MLGVGGSLHDVVHAAVEPLVDELRVVVHGDDRGRLVDAVLPEQPPVVRPARDLRLEHVLHPRERVHLVGQG